MVLVVLVLVVVVLVVMAVVLAFFPRLLGFWGKGSMIHSHPALSIFIFKVEVSWHTGQDQSTEAQRAETTVDECSLTSFV